jgi:hypothetical protein
VLAQQDHPECRAQRRQDDPGDRVEHPQLGQQRVVRQHGVDQQVADVENTEGVGIALHRQRPRQRCEGAANAGVPVPRPSQPPPFAPFAKVPCSALDSRIMPRPPWAQPSTACCWVSFGDAPDVTRSCSMETALAEEVDDPLATAGGSTVSPARRAAPRAHVPAAQPGFRHRLSTCASTNRVPRWSSPGAGCRCIPCDAAPNCGTRIDGPAGSLAYTGDTGLTDGLAPLCRDVDLLLAEATIDITDTGPHGHLSGADAGVVAQEHGVRELVITHFTTPDPAVLDRRRAAAAARFDGLVHVAAPGRRFSVSRPLPLGVSEVARGEERRSCPSSPRPGSGSGSGRRSG